MEHSRPPMINGTSVCPQATQAIFGSASIVLLCLFRLGCGGTTERVDTSIAGFADTGFGAAGLRTRLGFVVLACVGRIDFIIYGDIADCNR